MPENKAAFNAIISLVVDSGFDPNKILLFDEINTRYTLIKRGHLVTAYAVRNKDSSPGETLGGKTYVGNELKKFTAFSIGGNRYDVTGGTSED